MGCAILTEKVKKGKIDVVTAFAEPACGPGWSNSPVWVICRNCDGSFYMECIQPEDQTRDMRLLYRITDILPRVTRSYQ